MKGAKKIPTTAKEYSKRVLSSMIALWFGGAVFGAAVVVWQLIAGEYYVGIDALLQYIGLPMGGGIVGYLIKSAIENKEKIKKIELAQPDTDGDTPEENNV